MLDYEVLEITLRTAIRYTPTLDAAEIANATTILYPILAKKKAENFPINDEIAVQAMLEELRRSEDRS